MVSTTTTALSPSINSGLWVKHFLMNSRHGPRSGCFGSSARHITPESMKEIVDGHFSEAFNHNSDLGISPYSSSPKRSTSSAVRFSR